MFVFGSCIAESMIAISHVNTKQETKRCFIISSDICGRSRSLDRFDSFCMTFSAFTISSSPDIGKFVLSDSGAVTHKVMHCVYCSFRRCEPP